MSSYNDSGYMFFDEEAAATVLAFRAVKLSAAARTIVHAGAGEGHLVIGFTAESAVQATPDKWTVGLTNKPGTFVATVAAAAAVNQLLYCAAAGKLTPVPAGPPIARALEAASGDGAEIEVKVVSAAEADESTPFAILPTLGAAITAAALAAATGLTAGMFARSRTGGIYRLVLSDNVNGAPVGCPLGIRTAGTLSYDMSDDLAASTAAKVAGVAANVFSATNVYGWMLVQGDLEQEGMHIDTDGSVAAGNLLYWGADQLAHGILMSGTPADLVFFGRAHKDDVGAVLSKGSVGAFCGGGNMAA